MKFMEAKLRKTTFFKILNCIIHKGNPEYLGADKSKDSMKYKDFSIGRLIWMIIFLLLIVASIVLSILSCVTSHKMTATDASIISAGIAGFYDGVAGITTIGILTGAAFMVFGLFISNPLFIGRFRRKKQEILSLATLIIIFQLILTFICFLDILFPFCMFFCKDSPWIRIGLQAFTILFMVICDIHLILHIFTLNLTKRMTRCS